MSINIKKNTKDQMEKMAEDAQAEVQELRRVNAALTEQISQMHGEAITRENVIAKLKADANGLRNKLDATAEAHPWRNLWAWVKRKFGGDGNEHVS